MKGDSRVSSPWLKPGVSTRQISMIGIYKVITLCGSTKFKDEFLKAQKELTLAGNIVISVGLFGHSGDAISDEQKVMLDNMHKKKIDMADEIFVINKNGYIGASTQSEIDYARKKNKPVNFMYTCGNCKKFIGGGDWNLCCREHHEVYPLGFICYKDSGICEKYEGKE